MINRYYISRFILLTIGSLMGAVSVVVFLLPHNIAPAGISGVAVILNELISTPVGLVVIVGNIPIQILAYRELFGWRAVIPTIYAILLYSLAIDLIPVVVDIDVVSDDLLLNAIFGGMLTGLGGGLIYRAGGSYGGTSTLARIMRRRFGLSISTASIFTDVFILVGAGLVFGWEAALYALVVLFIGRSVSDYVLDGTGQSYTALIISEQAHALSRALEKLLNHRVTLWHASNRAYEKEYDLLMVSIYRNEMHGLRKLLEEVDPDAFVTVLEAHATFGKEFKGVASRLPLQLDKVDDSVSRQIRRDNIEDVISS